MNKNRIIVDWHHPHIFPVGFHSFHSETYRLGLNQQNKYYCGKDKYYVDEEHLCSYTPRSVVGVEWNDNRKPSKVKDG